MLIVDDLVQTGGTLGKLLKEGGAATFNAIVPQAVFPQAVVPQESWKRFNEGGDRNCLDEFG
jgi:adenine/guanine phosphoribosyltransferase-like PRPP-binding protein